MYPPQQNASDQTAAFFWIMAMIMGGFLLVWWLRPEWIVVPIFWLRIHEISFLLFFSSVWDHIATFLHLPTLHEHILKLAKRFMLTKISAPKHVDFNQMKAINVYVGKWMRFPCALVLFVLAWIAFYKHDSMRFRRTYKMNDLKREEVENWPQITPVMSLNLVKQDLEKGPWAMAKTPLAFAKEFDLLELKEDVEKKKIWSIKQGPAYRAFTLQLGSLWRGIHVLPIHLKALLIVFLARSERKNKIADELLMQISESASSTGKLNFAGVEELVKQFENCKLLKWLERHHAYVGTLMATALDVARTDGVLATAEFLWLKPVDRRMWYMLNSVGRQSAVVEVSGLFAHWRAEVKIKRALKTPMVKTAVVALDEAVADVLYIEEGETWHSSAA